MPRTLGTMPLGVAVINIQHFQFISRSIFYHLPLQVKDLHALPGRLGILPKGQTLQPQFGEGNNILFP